MSNELLVDANVLIDLSAPEQTHFRWAINTLRRLRIGGAKLIVNPLIVAEVTSGFETAADQFDFLDTLSIGQRDLPFDAAFPAGSAHQLYRKRGGTRATTLPDFLIGAHALVENLTLVTRDHQRFAAYFPMVPLISPETHPL